MSHSKEKTDDFKDNEQSMYQLVDIKFVYNAITDNVTLIDLRNWEQYTTSHIHKAIHVSIEASYLQPKDDTDVITNLSQLVCSHPQQLKSVYGRLVILYGDDKTDSKYYNFLFSLIDKQNCGDFKYYVMNTTFTEFQKQFPFLCIWNEQMIKESKEALLNQLYIECKSSENDEKQLEESNLSVYKRYSQILVVDTGYPNIILSDQLFLGDGRQSMNWSIIYNLQISHILNITRLVPNQFDGKHDLQTIGINVPSVLSYFNKNPVKYLKFQVLDMDKEPLTPYFNEAFTFIHNALNENEGNNRNKVLVHCQQGISRSSTMCIGYLMHSKQWSLADSYEYVKKRRKRTCPNKGFLKQLMELEKQLFDGKSTVDEIGKRGIRDLTQFRKYLDGKGKKERNEAKVLRESVKTYFSAQQK